jgi:hypothetical protein
MYEDGIAPKWGLNEKTLVLDRVRSRQMAWLSERLPLPVGSKIELFDPDMNTHGTATVTGIRLLNGTSHVPNQVGLDCGVEPRWWHGVDREDR